MIDNPTLNRLEDQIAWYDNKSQYNQKCYKRLKIASVVVAALIPIASLYFLAAVPAVMGVLIVIIEALQSINQHNELWFTYRSTAESLKHEKYLYLALAGPYENAEKPDTILAERLEKTISQEHARWVDSKDKQQKARYNNAS